MIDAQLTARLREEVDAFGIFQPQSYATQRAHAFFTDFVARKGPRLQEREEGATFYDLYTGFVAWDIDSEIAAFADHLVVEGDRRTAEALPQLWEEFLQRSFAMQAFLAESGECGMTGVPFARSVEKMREVHAFLQQRKHDDDKLYEKLLNHGVPELYAEIIIQQFENIEQLHPAQPSKNVVYHIVDERGNKKVLKFVPAERRAEADIEALVLHEFKKHPVLYHYVPTSFVSEPITISVGNYSFALLVEEDVTGKSPQQPVEYWLKALAHIHHFGTEVMDQIGNYKPALRLAKDKDEARIEQSGVTIDRVLRADLVQENTEDGNTFIHQDIRRQNRVGRYAIDWGHAGRGNPYLDVARVLLDSQLQQGRVYGSEDYKRSLALYTRERKQLSGITTPITAHEVEAAYLEFTKIGLLYAQSQLAYLREKGTLCTPGEIQDRKFLNFARLQLETKLQRRRN